MGSSTQRFDSAHAAAFYGTIISSGPDVAETYIVNDKVEFGDVVVIDKDKELKLCARESDPRVIGVVSTTPGVILHQADKGIAIGLMGCVPTKVDATKYPVETGDLLVTSSTPGYAMKAIDPKAGTVLGKALEPLSSGKGKIMVLIGAK